MPSPTRPPTRPSKRREGYHVNIPPRIVNRRPLTQTHPVPSTFWLHPHKPLKAVTYQITSPHHHPITTINHLDTHATEQLCKERERARQRDASATKNDTAIACLQKATKAIEEAKASAKPVGGQLDQIKCAVM